VKRRPKQQEPEEYRLPPIPALQRLKRTHSLMTAGETAMAIALADSLFLSVSPDAARGKIILFLAVSMAPFAVVSPLIGPRIDRLKGGHRMVVILVGIMRALVLVGISQSCAIKRNYSVTRFVSLGLQFHDSWKDLRHR